MANAQRDVRLRTALRLRRPCSDRSSDDVYRFGIRKPVKSCGCSCIRADTSAFTGDALGHIQCRIQNAKLVIADLTKARPNVYLESGYALGCGVPVLFVARKGQEIHFDLVTHKCLFYRNIRDLRKKLRRTLQDLWDSESDIHATPPSSLARRRPR